MSQSGEVARVGIACTRGFALITSILAVLKAGAAYIPLPPESPKARLRKMLSTGAPELVLFEPGHDAFLAGQGVATLPVELAALDHESCVAFEFPDARDIAYILFTSGSTGEPKGVEVAHHALGRYVDWATRTYIPGAALDRRFRYR